MSRLLARALGRVVGWTLRPPLRLVPVRVALLAAIMVAAATVVGAR